MLRRGILLAIFIISLIVLGTSLLSKTNSIAPSSTLVISEVKMKNDSSSLNEFVELYNNSDQQIDLGQYKIDYFNVYNPSSGQSPTTTKTFASGTTTGPSSFYILARDTTQIAGSSSLSSITSLKDDQGLIRLLGPDPDNTGQFKTYDELAWLDSSTLTDNVYKTPINAKSLQRYTAQTATPLVFEDDWLGDAPSPGTILYIPPVIPEPEEASTGITCEGILINELLPNAAGSDSGHEFIELYNPIDEVISLDGCSLQTSANHDTYDFSDVQMQPQQYFAFYDSQTGLTLPNSSGGTVWLLTPDEEIQEVTYQANLADDLAWARFDNNWQSTYEPTPNAQNSLLSVQPCPAGQTRNLETNRCQNVLSASSSGLEPCGPGRERNPLTNRCHLITGTSNSLTPCQPGQERNPETNRCRKVASSALKACAAGQFRNPKTNRCKKLAGSGQVAGLTDVKDVKSEMSDTAIPMSWRIAGLVGIGAIGYGVFEWRQDILNFINRIRRK